MASGTPEAVVSRLLRRAGGSSDPEAVHAAVVDEARAFFGAEAALLVALEDEDRRARVVGQEAKHPLASLPALAELVMSRARRGTADRVTLAALAPHAAEAEMLAVGGEVLFLTGAPNTDGPLSELFAAAAATVLEAARTAAAHQTHMERQVALTRAAKVLNESLDLETVLSRICAEAVELLGGDSAAVHHGTLGGGFLVGGVAGLPPEFVGTPLAPGDGLAGQVIRHGRSALTDSYQETTKLPPGSPLHKGRAAVSVPFGWDGELRGVLTVGWERPHKVGPDELTMLETFTELAGVACRNASAHAGLARAAQTDSLTGCINHAALHQALHRELGRAARDAVEPPSLVLIDLDHFKQVNEEHGHLTGDAVLRRVGTALRSGIRPYDIAARYGGDEFALLVTAADEETAMEVAARAVHRVTAAIAEFVEGPSAGATAGVATWTDGCTPSELVARADRALLHAKHTGLRGGVHPHSTVPPDWNRGRFDREEREALAPAPPVPAEVAERDERLRKRTRQLGLANALGARLAGMTDVQGILDATAEELHRAFGYFLCAVIRDEDGYVFAAATRGEAFDRLELADWRQPRGDGLIGRCLRTQRPVLVRDVTKEPDYHPTSETGAVRSELVVPLWSGGELWGAINLEELEPDAFDEDDARLVETVADQVGAALRSASLYEQLERAYLGTAEALVAALEAKDAYTAEHARALVEHAVAVGRGLGMGDGELRDLRFAAVFHDIGKIAIPEAILSKPGPLTPEERKIMESHTVIGEQILAPVEFLAEVRRMVRHEHERWDGAGYPDGLAGDDIPLGSRIILACDALHAMTSDRPYRKALGLDAAVEELQANAGSQFDPNVVRALLELPSVRG